MTLTLYRDEPNKFQASVNIHGSTGSDRIVRLILEFSNRKLLFDGVFKENRVIVEIPKLMDISEDQGTARLEVIADSAYFEPWVSEFELVMKKSVEVNEVAVERNEPATVVVADIHLENQEEPVEEAKELYTIGDDLFTDDCTPRNKNIAVDYLNDADNQEVEENREFSSIVTDWATGVFRDISSREAKLVMRRLEEKITV